MIPKCFNACPYLGPLQFKEAFVRIAGMVNFCVRFEQLSSKFQAHLYPILRNLSSGLFSFWNSGRIVVGRCRHSSEESTWVNFRSKKTRIFGGTLSENTIKKLTLFEFRCSKITPNEGTTLK